MSSCPDHSLQHGGVAWREWKDESFRLACGLDRPILLTISTTWYHWCHVMDRTSYSENLIHRHYIPIRVDNDRRPDINERYNMGGWLTTAFLAPTGDVLTDATYIPPEQMRASHCLSSLSLTPVLAQPTWRLLLNRANWQSLVKEVILSYEDY